MISKHKSCILKMETGIGMDLVLDLQPQIIHYTYKVMHSKQQQGRLDSLWDLRAITVMNLMEIDRISTSRTRYHIKTLVQYQSD